jgi:hypothetical protein
MFGILSPTLGALGAPPRRLVGRDTLDPAIVFARTQTASRATALNGASAWAEFAADAARHHDTARRLLIEGPQTNSLRNPRAEGGVAGTPGTTPTNWQVTQNPGLSREIVGIGTTGGINTIDVRFFGTPTSGSGTLLFETSQFIPAATGQTWTHSVFMALVAGTNPSPTLNLLQSVLEQDSAGTTLANNFGTDFLPLLTGSLARFVRTVTLTSAATAFVRPFIRMTWLATAPVDFTLRIGWPQMAQAGFAGTPILPLAGAPLAATRGIDSATAAFATLFPGGSGTLLWSGMLPQAASAAADQTLLQLDDGTDNNRFRLRNLAGGASITAGRVTGGAAGEATALGSMTAGTLFRVGATFSAGRLAACLNGGAVHAVSGGPTGGLTTLRLGRNAAGTAPMFGETAALSVLRFAVPDAALPGLTAAIPG